MENNEVNIKLVLPEVDMILLSLGQRADSYVELKDRIYKDAVNQVQEAQKQNLETQKQEPVDSIINNDIIQADEELTDLVEIDKNNILIDNVNSPKEENKEIKIVEECGGDFYDDNEEGEIK